MLLAYLSDSVSFLNPDDRNPGASPGKAGREADSLPGADPGDGKAGEKISVLVPVELNGWKGAQSWGGFHARGQARGPSHLTSGPQTGSHGVPRPFQMRHLYRFLCLLFLLEGSLMGLTLSVSSQFLGSPE